MAAFDTTKQKMVTLAGARMETGANVTIAGVSGQSFTVATKLRKVIGGFGVMRKDNIPVFANVALTSNGQATFYRRGPISKASGSGTYDAADTVDYILFGH